MKNKILLFGVAIALLACHSNTNYPPHSVLTKKIDEDHLILTDEAAANKLDAKFKQLEQELLEGKFKQFVFVKQKGSKEIITVPDGQDLPEDVTFLYTLLKNKKGKPVIFDEYPVSQDGSWEIIYRHYFDEEGRTFAFLRQTNFPNSVCTDGQAYETIKEYYTPDFQVVQQFYQLLDVNGTQYKKVDCLFRYDFDYAVYSNSGQVIEERLKGVSL